METGRLDRPVAKGLQKSFIIIVVIVIAVAAVIAAITLPVTVTWLITFHFSFLFSVPSFVHNFDLIRFCFDILICVSRRWQRALRVKIGRSLKLLLKLK